MRFYYTKKLPGFTALFCILWAVLIQSCKKTDKDVVVKDELTTTTPYLLAGKDNKQVAKVFKELNKRGLSEGAFTRYGKLLWDKSIELPYVHSQSPTYLTKVDNDIDSVVIIPIVPENTKEVTAYLQAWIGDTISLAIYTKYQYTALAFGNTLNNGVGEAEKLALQFMRLNKLVFNYTAFQITDKRLFTGNIPVIDTAKAGVLIRLREPENNISSRLRYVELCVDIIRTNCTTPTAPQCMPVCDNCPGYCQTTETICTGWWEDDNPGGGEDPALPDPGDGSGGATDLPGPGDPCGGGRIMGARLPPCGGGGGGTGGGSGGGWIPIVPLDDDPCSEVASVANSAKNFTVSDEFLSAKSQIVNASVNSNKEHAISFGIDANGDTTTSIMNNGSMHNAQVPNSNNQFADLHNHPNPYAPSPGDMYSLITYLNTNKVGYLRYVITPNGSIYLMTIVDLAKANSFNLNYPKNQIAGFPPNFPDDIADEYNDIKSYLKNIKNVEELIADEMAMAFILEKYNTGVALLKQDSGGDFKRIITKEEPDPTGGVTYISNNCI